MKKLSKEPRMSEIFNLISDLLSIGYSYDDIFSAIEKEFMHHE